MATKRPTPTKKTEQVFYAVIPDKYSPECGDEITVFKSIERAFFDAEHQYDTDPATDKFNVYEIRKKGTVNIKVDITLS